MMFSLQSSQKRFEVRSKIASQQGLSMVIDLTRDNGKEEYGHNLKKVSFSHTNINVERCFFPS